MAVPDDAYSAKERSEDDKNERVGRTRTAASGLVDIERATIDTMVLAITTRVLISWLQRYRSQKSIDLDGIYNVSCELLRYTRSVCDTNQGRPIQLEANDGPLRLSLTCVSSGRPWDKQNGGWKGCRYKPGV
jgi:hypothetical protein